MPSNFMRSDPNVPDIGDGPLSVTPYLSQEFFEGERDNIFGKVWLNIARGCELPARGDFVVRQVEIRNASVIVVRGEDGEFYLMELELIEPSLFLDHASDGGAAFVAAVANPS